ncbi:Chromate transporter [Geobacillus sp. C56-T3]|nr:chromate transporter [Geobacillus sp. C56-T3]ADI28237.1 Chromate transporter [Geobacillus sp. C56-T3]
MNQWHLFLAFFRVGMLGYGGGPSSIPLVRAEVVAKYRWMADEEFAEIAASAFLMFGKWRLHPAYVIALSLVYGAFFLS